MRTIGFRSNILFAIAAAIGVVASLGQPWYGPSAEATDAQMEDYFSGLARVFSESTGTTGWAALQTADALLAGLSVATVSFLVLALVPAIQTEVQVLARWTALATLGVVLVKLVDGPGTNAMAEPRQGIFVALAAAGVLVASAITVANAPVRRRPPVKRYAAAPAPVVERDATGSPIQF